MFFSAPCEEVESIDNICQYEKDNFNLICFGKYCGGDESDIFDQPSDFIYLWEQCNVDEEVNVSCKE